MLSMLVRDGEYPTAPHAEATVMAGRPRWQRCRRSASQHRPHSPL